ncbi:MAG: acyl-[acyl-carrier-protein] thioesterase [Atopobiaceae bacterium]
MYAFDSRVRYSESDGEGRLSLYALMNYFQDCSTFQSEHLGIGLEHLKSLHLGWIVGTWHIEIESLPRFCERIETSTWAYHVKGLQAKRCFQMKREDGTSCVKADSLWFMFDLENQRVINVPESEYAYMDEAEPRLDIGPLLRRVKAEGPATTMRPSVVTEQFLDTNHHMNNANYVLLALQALPAECLPHTIDVQYKRAAMLGDTIVPIVHTTEDGHAVDLTAPDGTSYAVVRFAQEEI